MKVFDIYQHSDGKTVAIRRGFSWPAFLAQGAWAARAGLFTQTIGLMAVFAALDDLAMLMGASPIDVGFMFVLSVIGLGAYAGHHGNRWLRGLARDQGAGHAGLVVATSRRAALDAWRRDDGANRILGGDPETSTGDVYMVPRCTAVAA